MKQAIAEIRIVNTKGGDIYCKQTIIDFEQDMAETGDLQINFDLDPVKISRDDAVIVTFESRKELIQKLFETDFNC